MSNKELRIAGMAEAAGSPVRILKQACGSPIDSFIPGDHHLCNALTVPDLYRFPGKVDYGQQDLSPVIGIDGTGRIKAGEAMLDGKAASGAHLRLVACGKLYE